LSRYCRRCYDIGEPDGAVGKKTIAAIADFEQKQGMPVNGRASQKALEELPW
jgi:peptidoglycan hydrolase-like protein with peptidoglycan-binding domain